MCDDTCWNQLLDLRHIEKRRAANCGLFYFIPDAREHTVIDATPHFVSSSHNSEIVAPVVITSSTNNTFLL